MNIETITREDLKNNYSLYQKMLKVLEFVDGKKPEGTCCGKGKENAINKFIDNRAVYVEKMNKIRDRKIIPLFAGAVYFTAVKKRYYADRLTDEDSLYLIENGYAKFFDMSGYNIDEVEVKEESEIVPENEENGAESKTEEEPTKVVKKTTGRKAKKSNKR